MSNGYIEKATKTNSLLQLPAADSFVRAQQLQKSFKHHAVYKQNQFCAISNLFSKRFAFFVGNHRMVYGRSDFAYSWSTMNDSLSRFVYVNHLVRTCQARLTMYDLAQFGVICRPFGLTLFSQKSYPFHICKSFTLRSSVLRLTHHLPIWLARRRLLITK